MTIYAKEKVKFNTLHRNINKKIRQIFNKNYRNSGRRPLLLSVCKKLLLLTNLT